jgi:hypothetical protein
MVKILLLGSFWAALLGTAGCSLRPAQPGIEFTVVPEASPGGSEKMEQIAGIVRGAKAGDRILVLAKSGTWWVQPYFSKPFTEIRSGGGWSASIHLGSHYAALLVDPTYIPPRTADELPAAGRGVIAVATVAGKSTGEAQALAPKALHFSGYEWEARQTPTDSGGIMHANSAANAWVDETGFLHLRITKEGNAWNCAEVILRRSLGYGTYSFVVRDPPRLEPGTVLGLFTWDELEAGQDHREIDVELSQWGDPEAKNAQFVVQPYYVPANVFRFVTPPGTLNHSFRWEPGRASFTTKRERSQRVVAEHVFTSGVPSPGGEAVHINLYLYGKSRTPQKDGLEIVIEKFEFLP